MVRVSVGWGTIYVYALVRVVVIVGVSEVGQKSVGQSTVKKRRSASNYSVDYLLV